jgi:hypothetical protein
MVETRYQARIVGCVPDDVLRELGAVTVAEQPAQTLVTGSFPDQAALHGFLARLRAFGLDLVELRAVPAPADESPTAVPDEQS